MPGQNPVMWICVDGDDEAFLVEGPDKPEWDGDKWIEGGGTYELENCHRKYLTQFLGLKPGDMLALLPGVKVSPTTLRSLAEEVIKARSATPFATNVVSEALNALQLWLEDHPEENE